MRRHGESGIDGSVVAGSPIKAEIAGNFGRNLDSSRRTGGSNSRYRRQRRIVDNDLLRGVQRLVSRLGDDQRYRLADIEGLVCGQ
jgi:hypothetical protein